MKISSKRRQKGKSNNVSSERTTRSSSTPRSLRRSDLSLRRTETKQLKRDIAGFKKQLKVLKKTAKPSSAGRLGASSSRKASSDMIAVDGENALSNTEGLFSEEILVDSLMEKVNRCSDRNGFADGTEMLIADDSHDIKIKPEVEGNEGTVGAPELEDDANKPSISDDELVDQIQEVSQFPVAQDANNVVFLGGKRRRKRRRILPKKKSKNAKIGNGTSKVVDDSPTLDSAQLLVDTSMVVCNDVVKPKRGRISQRNRATKSIVKELQTSTGFVDKVDLEGKPEELVSMKRKPRMASLNALAKVNAVLESYSPLAGRTMTEIKEKAQSKKSDISYGLKEDKRRKRSTSSVTQTDDILFFSSMKGENNEWMLSGPSNVFKQSSIIYDHQPISDSRVSSTSNFASEDESTTTKDKAVQTIVNHKAVQTDVVLLDDITIANSPSSCTCGYLENMSSKEHTSSDHDSGRWGGWSVSNTQTTIYKTPPTVTATSLNVPLCSSISTKTTTHTIAIPFTKTHLLTHTNIGDFKDFENHSFNGQSSKRMASLNAIAMINAMRVLDRPLFSYATDGSSGALENEQSEKQTSGPLRIPKISFQATSTSRFSVGGKSKAMNPIKVAQMKSLSNLLAEGKKQQARQSNKIINGWVFEGDPMEKPFPVDDRIIVRRYYSSIRRNEEVINVRDAVLLKSGPRKKDLPFVARVAAIWEEDGGNLAGDMMISVFWYYRPEQTEVGKLPGYHGELEVLASRHRDDNSAACVVDKCYVLSYPQYCRFRAKNKLHRESRRTPLSPVPATESTRPGIIPPPNTDPNLVFFCRHAYDSRTGKILKNPFY